MKSIGLIGGTGPEGKGLSARFARGGLQIIIGSRSEDKGEAAAAEIAALAGGRITGGTNSKAAAEAEIVVLSVPYDGMRETVSSLSAEIGDKIVISAVVPLRFSRAQISAVDVADGSAAQEAQRLLPQARVAAAFQNLPARHLTDLSRPLDGDVIVCSDHPQALLETIALAEVIEGVRGVNGGPLFNARYVEQLTALLLNLNRLHKTETHLKIIGL